MMKSLNRIILTLLYLTIFTGTALAQSNSLPDQFDLVIFGNGLQPADTEVSLKENPGIENKWQEITEGVLYQESDKSDDILIYRNLSTATFAGQDIRENYIALKLSGSNNAQLKAVYALPNSSLATDELGTKLLSAIQHHPQKLRQFSIASQIRPRPVALSNNSEFTEHIEMPVRHIKPGINEVEWLDIIFSRD